LTEYIHLSTEDPAGHRTLETQYIKAIVARTSTQIGNPVGPLPIRQDAIATSASTEGAAMTITAS